MNTNSITRNEGSLLRKTTTAFALAALLATAGRAAAAAGPLVDLNSATVAQLEALPGIGPSKAQAIVDERKNGKFASIDDLERVKGIGPAIVAQLRDRVTAGAEQQQK